MEVLRKSKVLLEISNYMEQLASGDPKTFDALTEIWDKINNLPVEPMPFAELLTIERYGELTGKPVYKQLMYGNDYWCIAEPLWSVSTNLYGKTWRCWTSEPTPEQLETPWEPKLNACPFCGSTNVSYKIGRYKVVCNTCGATCGKRKTVDEAVAAWNGRARHD